MRYKLPEPAADPSDDLAVVRSELRELRLHAAAVESLAKYHCTAIPLLALHVTQRLAVDQDDQVVPVDEDGSAMRGATVDSVVLGLRRAYPFAFDGTE